ncbi:MAG: hypothetical protein J7K83_00755 [Candidatus Aenigmarchaeota archaeon]|nr:hypothetical protein [Candidatus Aenigmarchaeota archaeon]
MCYPQVIDMRRFYSDKEISFGKPKHKIDGWMKLVILVVFLVIFSVSLLPLIHFVYAKINDKLIYSPSFMYYLFDGRPNSYGAIAYHKEEYAVFFSDIFFGGFKPLILVNKNGAYQDWVELSDSLSKINKTRLSDFEYVTRTYNNIIYQAYFYNNSKIAEKRIIMHENRVEVSFKSYGNSTTIVLYLHDDSLGCIKIFDTSYEITGNSIEIQPHSNIVKIEFIPSGEKNKVEVIDPFLILYPLITLVILSSTWWYYANKE